MTVDPVDVRGMNEVDVAGRRACVARQQTSDVHRHQGALRTEAAKVDGRGAGRAVGDIAALAGEDLRQRVDEVFRPGDALELHFLAVDDGDRAGALELGTGDTRTGDDDGIARGRFVSDRKSTRLNSSH